MGGGARQWVADEVLDGVGVEVKDEVVDRVADEVVDEVVVDCC